MLVIEKKNFSLHNPSWKFTLGPETYETKDTPKRVEAIKNALAAEGRFKFKTARRFQETHLSRIHPYHDYIKKTSQLATSTLEVSTE